MKAFPVVVTAVFIALALLSVFIFATFTSFKKNAIGTVAIWGSLPHSAFDVLVAKLGDGNDTYSGVTYRSLPEDQLIPTLVEAIAAGNGPDLVVFPAGALVGEGNKLSSISYSTLSRRDFQDTFIEGGEVFLGSDGVKAIPFTVDPLVMYWNRTLFSAAGIAQPPRYWDELGAMSAKLTKATQNGTLTQSAVALGAWDNVAHAKSILLTLFRQLGNTVVERDSKGAFVSTLFSGGEPGAASAADSAVRFYTDFSDPAKPVYSWNRSQPSSRSAFLAGKLAVYFGTVSELHGVREANPNLNFDIAPVPSIRGGGAGVAADITGLAIPRGSRNPAGALVIAKDFTTASSLEALAGSLMLPSVRRDAPPPASNDQYAALFHNAALVSFSFLDPDIPASDSVFKRMVEGVSSGRLQVSDATKGADDELKALLGTPQ
jgi:multiple sugar transport system substrate-binding protein